MFCIIYVQKRFTQPRNKPPIWVEIPVRENVTIKLERDNEPNCREGIDGVVRRFLRFSDIVILNDIITENLRDPLRFFLNTEFAERDGCRRYPGAEKKL